MVFPMVSSDMATTRLQLDATDSHPDIYTKKAKNDGDVVGKRQVNRESGGRTIVRRKVG